ncbi:hypothetical protein [Actinoplanes sp. CA-252034]|uniref:hypothetical protein n=1 Tax=Actinoplanes sp. CA-252034 TaxID=3239906 RepID=UPI003D960FD7
MQPTETKDQAAERVEALVREAFTQVPTGATLKFSDGSDIGSCDDAESGAPRGRIFAERRYNLIPDAAGSWPAEQTIPALVAFWEQQGYRVHDDRRSERPPRFVVRTPDDYSVVVDAWDRDGYYDYTLSASSPCIWENGTPDPK